MTRARTLGPARPSRLLPSRVPQLDLFLGAPCATEGSMVPGSQHLDEADSWVQPLLGGGGEPLKALNRRPRSDGAAVRWGSRINPFGRLWRPWGPVRPGHVLLGWGWVWGVVVTAETQGPPATPISPPGKPVLRLQGPPRALSSVPIGPHTWSHHGLKHEAWSLEP